MWGEGGGSRVMNCSKSVTHLVYEADTTINSVKKHSPHMGKLSCLIFCVTSLTDSPLMIYSDMISERANSRPPIIERWNFQNFWKSRFKNFENKNWTVFSKVSLNILILLLATLQQYWLSILRMLRLNKESLQLHFNQD